MKHWVFPQKTLKLLIIRMLLHLVVWSLLTVFSDLPDGLTTKWNTTLVSTIIQDSLFSNPVDIVSIPIIYRSMDRPLNP